MPGGEVSVARRKAVRYPRERNNKHGICPERCGFHCFIDLPESVLSSLELGLFQRFSIRLDVFVRTHIT